MSNESMASYITDTPSEIAELLAENRQYRHTNKVQADVIGEQRKELEALRLENKELRDGLQFYASVTSWRTCGIVDHCMDAITMTDTEYCSPSEKFGGKRARELIQKLTAKEGEK